MSTFPQAAASTMQALRSTSLNLNPQQDGLKIYVSLPKVTREHRESVAKAAKSRLTETKSKLRALLNNYTKAGEFWCIAFHFQTLKDIEIF